MSKAFKFTDNNYLDSTGIVHNREKLSDILGRKDDTLPIGAIIDFTGSTIPDGYARYVDPDVMSETILFDTNTWDSMMKRYETKNIDFTPYTYVEVHFTGQGSTNATNTILKIDLTKPFKIVITNNDISYSYGASVCFPDVQLLQGSNNDPGIFRIGACISTDKKKIWMGDAGYFTGQTNSGNFDANTIYSRISKIVGFKPTVRIKKIQQPASYPENSIYDAYSTSTTDTYSCNYINSIVESGSNENGSWIKWADGTMICYKRQAFNNVAITTTWGTLYESKKLELGDFPQPFVGNYPDFFIMPWQPFFVERVYTASLTSWGAFWATKPYSSTMDVIVSCFAIGRWK